MCLDSQDKEAKPPKSVLAFKYFKITSNRDKKGKHILYGRFRGGKYVRGRLYKNKSERVLLSGNGWAAYPAGFHAYATTPPADASPTHVGLFVVKLSRITTVGYQNGVKTYVAQRMTIIRRIKQ